MVEPPHRRGGIQCETRLASVLANQRERAIDMLGGLRMKRNDRRAGVGKIGDQTIDGPHHEMHVDRRRRVGLDRRAHEGTYREIRHVMVIHHVEVDEIGACVLHSADFFTEPREIGGQQTRRNADGHGSLSR